MVGSDYLDVGNGEASTPVPGMSWEAPSEVGISQGCLQQAGLPALGLFRGVPNHRCSLGLLRGWWVRGAGWCGPGRLLRGAGHLSHCVVECWLHVRLWPMCWWPGMVWRATQQLLCWQKQGEGMGQRQWAGALLRHWWPCPLCCKPCQGGCGCER